MCSAIQYDVSGREGLLRSPAIQRDQFLKLNFLLCLNLCLRFPVNVRDLASVLQTDIIAPVFSFGNLVVADCSVHSDTSQIIKCSIIIGEIVEEIVIVAG